MSKLCSTNSSQLQSVIIYANIKTNVRVWTNCESSKKLQYRFSEVLALVAYTGASNAGRETYCEYYASQIEETMRLNAVHMGGLK